MKFLSKAFFLLNIFNFSIAEYNKIDYSTLIKSSVLIWENECISKLSSQEILVIADMLLLSYQVVHASFIMSQARLTMQTELLKMVTLSIDDTLEAHLQAESNDLTIIKNTITTIEQAQEKIKFACNAFKNFGPLIIHIDPTTIQLFIAHIKMIILDWIKTQEKITLDFKDVEKEFATVPELFKNVQNIFEKMSVAGNTESHLLIEGTYTLNTLYNNIETIYSHLTTIRQESIVHFNHLLTLYFKDHYEVLYNYIQDYNDLDNYIVIATKNQKFPKPEEIFFIQ